MAKLSVVVPSRDERFLIPTIRDVFHNRRGDTEVVAVLDSDKWPDGWKELVAEFPDLHTIHNGTSLGMRPAINRGVASAASRKAKYILKLDGHCMLDEGFDVKLQADMEPNWVVVPRRKRLDAENWTLTDTHKPDIDYHYLSFPDDPNDFGGPGLNGKVWEQRARERRDKPEYEIDDEMASQGSAWFMAVDYFYQLELMDDANYGPFWNEAQEIFNKCWLSGGRCVINKKTWYAHLHKGKKYGRGYRLPEDWLKQGATFTKKWLYNEAWAKQTLPFKTLIERFWPVPTWPENWEELVYDSSGKNSDSDICSVNSELNIRADVRGNVDNQTPLSLVIHSAHYGIGGSDDIDVRKVLQRNVINNVLDVMVSNAFLEVGNPFRGQKKKLRVTYSYDGGEPVSVEREERDWLIIGQSARYVKQLVPDSDGRRIGDMFAENRMANQLIEPAPVSTVTLLTEIQKLSAPALNDFLTRRFQIPSHRLRGPMPIEVPTFHRDDLAKLFAELGMNKGAEIGVAEGNYSEVLVRANPNLELLCVDPWHAYSGNPQNKSKEKNEYAYNEAKRKLAGTKARLVMKSSIDAVRDVDDGSLDFVYIDGNHSFDFVMFDLIAWSKKVRSGGIMAGDDYYFLDPKRWGAGPVEAVQAYTSAHKISPWFICNAHRSVDYFWVKL